VQVKAIEGGVIIFSIPDLPPGDLL
jgi:hypothetical protein